MGFATPIRATLIILLVSWVLLPSTAQAFEWSGYLLLSGSGRDFAADGKLMSMQAGVPGTGESSSPGFSVTWSRPGGPWTQIAVPPREDPRRLPFRVFAPLPNPSLGSAAITFQLSDAGHAVVAVYDVGGHLVRTLCNERHEAGRHTLNWDGRDDNGRRVSAGLYLVQVRSGSRHASRKLTVVR